MGLSLIDAVNKPVDFSRLGVNSVPVSNPTKTMKKSTIVIALAAAVIFVTSCATLNPGADPIVVNAERVEIVAVSAFDTVVTLDNSNRGFWATNAPAFHNFAEWLRTPVTIESTNVTRRGLAMVKLVDDAKIIYKSNASQSNILIQAVADLQIAITQAQAWQTIVQTPTH
jgi:hypothetical protein